MLFEKTFPDKLRSLIPLSEVIGKKVKLQARGKEFIGLCPFHNENTPSFTVNDQKEFYHCFGCQAHGDVIKFTMETEGLDFKEAVEKLANDFGIEIPLVKEINKEEVNKLNREYEILEEICKFFEKNLHQNSDINARNYLKTRGLNSAIAKKFRLGFAADSYDVLTNHLKSLNFSEEEMLESAAIGKNSRGNLFDKFRNRIIFPILDKKGRAIAFGGRSIDGSMPKYLNSQETNIFKKKQTLYNISNARKEILTKGYAILAEGYMDVISLANQNINNAVAGLGTAVSKEHLTELFYISDKIIICLDGDNAGIIAAKRILDISLEIINAKKNIFFCILPNKMDPDDFVTKFGREEFIKYVENAAPLSEALMDFSIDEIVGNNKDKITAENKAKIENILEQKIAKISDAPTKKYFRQFFKDSLFYLGKKNNKTHSSVLNKTKFFTKTKNDKININSLNILAFSIKFPDLLNYKDKEFDFIEMSLNDDILDEIKENIVDFSQNSQDYSGDSIIKYLEDNLPGQNTQNYQKTLQSIKNILASLDNISLESYISNFRILLLQDLLSQIEGQYRESLKQIEEIDTHKTAVTNQKIKEIFDYKNTIEKEILSLKRELI